MNTFKVPNAEVVRSIQRVYGEKAAEVLSELKYDHICRCWYFVKDGVYFGVEEDGYIHC